MKISIPEDHIEGNVLSVLGPEERVEHFIGCRLRGNNLGVVVACGGALTADMQIHAVRERLRIRLRPGIRKHLSSDLIALCHAERNCVGQRIDVRQHSRVALCPTQSNSDCNISRFNSLGPSFCTMYIVPGTIWMLMQRSLLPMVHDDRMGKRWYAGRPSLPLVLSPPCVGRQMNTSWVTSSAAASMTRKRLCFDI